MSEPYWNMAVEDTITCPPGNQVCALCDGSGKGGYMGTCVRCGAYGSFTMNAPNTPTPTEEEQRRRS